MKKGTRINDRYRLVKRLGKGGMGDVWVAHDIQLLRQVAIKFLDADSAEKNPELLPLFKDEARHGAALGFHPCIVPVIDTGELKFDGQYHRYFVQEYMEGIGLEEWVEQAYPVMDDTTYVRLSLYIGHQLSCAVEHAHKHGIVHRDITPHNLLLSVTGEIKLTDFGLCKLIDQATRAHTARAWGTVPYMAPEQVMDDASSKRSDVYQFGASLFYTVTGTPPFEGTTFRELQADLKKPAPKFSDYMDADTDLLSALDRTLSKREAARPSITEVRRLIAPQIQWDASLVARLSDMTKGEKDRFFSIAGQRRKARRKEMRVSYPTPSDFWQGCVALTVGKVFHFIVDG